MPGENRLIHAVHRVTQNLSSVLDVDEGLRRTLEVAIEAVDATGGTIWLHNPHQQELVCRHVVGEKAAQLIGFALHDDQGIAGHVFQSGVPEMENNTRRNPHFFEQVDEQIHYHTRNLVTAPLRYPGGEIVGVMQLLNKSSGDFTEDDLTVLDIIASVSAMSLHTADLARQAKKGALMDYLGRLAHDIKNIDSKIITPVWHLKDLLNEALAHISVEVPSEQAAQMRAEVSEMFSYVAEGAEYMHRYTSFLAEVASGEPIKARLEPNDLSAVVEKPVHLLEPTARREHSVRILTDFQAHLHFPFDSFLIERAVFNLVNNAIPHVPPGGMVIVRTAQEGDEAIIEVRDTGHGMPHHILESVLSGHAVSSTRGGTGLGTKIVKEVVELHHGRFEGESHLGLGTMFRLRLPLHPPNTDIKTS